MVDFLLSLHLIIAVAMVILVLLQRSEGGALGIGGGGGGGLVSGRGLGNTLTRSTAILAAMFFATSIALTIFSAMDANRSVLDSVIETDRNAPITAPTPVLPSPE